MPSHMNGDLVSPIVCERGACVLGFGVSDAPDMAINCVLPGPQPGPVVVRKAAASGEMR
jgi:hypothetical protein